MGTMNRLMAGLFLAICVIFIVHEVRQKPRVLVLHSYHRNYSWSQEVTEGINRVFAGKHYAVQWYYMDTKRHPDEAFKARAVRNAQQVIDQWRPNVVIAIADNAQRVMRPYINTEINIVFAGVVAEPGDYGYDDGAANVAGILERWPMAVIKGGLETVFIPDRIGCEPHTGQLNVGRSLTVEQPSRTPLRIRHIGDRSTTGLLIAKRIEAFDWGMNLEISSVSVGDFEAWKGAIARANQEADVALFSLYHTLYRDPVDEAGADDGGREVVSPAEVMRWTQEQLMIPGVGGWGFYVEHGGMMAIGVSAYEQGGEAARLATKIIDEGRSPATLERLESKQFLISLRVSLLERHGIEVPRIYEAFARANNNYYP